MEKEEGHKNDTNGEMNDEEYSVAPSSNTFQTCACEDGQQGKCHDSDDDHEMREAGSKDASLNEEIQVPSSMVEEEEVNDPSGDSMPMIQLFMGR